MVSAPLRHLLFCLGIFDLSLLLTILFLCSLSLKFDYPFDYSLSSFLAFGDQRQKSEHFAEILSFKKIIWKRKVSRSSKMWDDPPSLSVPLFSNFTFQFPSLKLQCFSFMSSKHVRIIIRLKSTLIIFKKYQNFKIISVYL